MLIILYIVISIADWFQQTQLKINVNGENIEIIMELSVFNWRLIWIINSFHDYVNDISYINIIRSCEISC